MKRPLIFAFCVLLLFKPLGLLVHATAKSQGASASAANDLSRRLEAAMDARKPGDPAAISRASQQVIALALAQMAKIRLDQKAYEDAANLCQQSLEFEDTAETRVEIAIANLYAKRPSHAIKQATIAAEMDPQNALAWTIKGEALLRIQNYSNAVAALNEAVKLKSDTESIYALGIAQLGAGEKQKAAGTFNQMLALTGDFGWSRVLIARAYQEQRMVNESTVEFQNALRIDHRTPEAHYYWALMLLEGNDWKPTPEAQLHLQEELKLNPQHFLSNYLLGVFASIQKDYDSSDRYLNIAAESHPSQPEIWMYLGLNARGRGDNRTAERYLRKAITLNEAGNPKEHLFLRQAYLALGRILVSSGRKKEGEDLLKKVAELDAFKQRQEVATMNAAAADGETRAIVPETAADDWNALFGKDHLVRSHQDTAGKAEKYLRALLGSSFNDLATAEALEEKYDLALKHYREAASWDSGIPGLRRNLGLAAFFAGQHGEAIRLLRKVVTETPGDAHARAVLGLAYFATNDFTKAAQTIAPIADRAVQDPQLGFAWAKSLAETGNKIAAVRSVQKLDNLGTNLSIENLIQFGKLSQELGQSERAAQFFRRALIIDPANADAKCALRLAECP